MAKTWTVHEARSENLVTADGFNQEYDALKSSLNGGVDRTMMPPEYFDRTHLKDGCFHNVSLSTDIQLNSSYAKGGGAEEFDGVVYEDYGGGQVETFKTTISGLKDGIAHVEFKCWYLLNMFTSGRGGSNELQGMHTVRWFITYNGSKVIESSKMAVQWGNPHLTADFPIFGGDAEIKILFSITPKLTDGSADDDDTTSMFFFGGGQFLFIPRWR